MNKMDEAELISAQDEIADFIESLHGSYRNEHVLQAVILCAAAGARSYYELSELEAIRHLQKVFQSWGDSIERAL